MPYDDLREYLSALETDGLLKWVTKEVDKDWEISCATRLFLRSFPEEKRFAVGFRKVKGYDIPVVVGATGASKRVIAKALETEPEGMKILEKWDHGLANPIKPLEVDSGPCKEVVLYGDDADLYRFPNPTWTPGKDPAPFLTPLFITKDPETGIQNVGMYRAQVKGKDKTGILVPASQHATIHISKWEAMGKSTPAAMVVGADPTVYITGVTPIPYGVDELAVSGGLRGSPVKVVKCETVDLEVPATAELVIEGEILYKVREPEGPFGEFTGYMAASEFGMPVFKVKCITHREDMIYQGVISQLPPSESSSLKQVFWEGTLLRTLVHDLKIPGIIDVHGPESGGVIAWTWIRMKVMYPGHVQQVMNAVMTRRPGYLKFIVITDEDVNIRDPFAREWVLAFRVRAEDIHITPKTVPLNLDPSSGSETMPTWERENAKVVIDATRSSKKWKFAEVALPSKKYFDKVREQLSKYGLPPLELDFQLPVDIT